MAYKEGECFNCGAKIPIGSVCDKCKKRHDQEELEEDLIEQQQRDDDDREAWEGDNL